MIEKCNSCGEVAKLITYNGNKACMNCLSMDKKGIPRDFIKERIEAYIKFQSSGKRRFDK